eukprot:2544184-Rhodomonas_salina.1
MAGAGGSRGGSTDRRRRRRRRRKRRRKRRRRSKERRMALTAARDAPTAAPKLSARSYLQTRPSAEQESTLGPRRRSELVQSKSQLAIDDGSAGSRELQSARV